MRDVSCAACIAVAGLALAVCSDSPNEPGEDTAAIHCETHALTVGGSTELTAIDRNGMAISDARVTWSSSSGSVATVDRDGIVSALAPGNVEIRAAVADRSAVLMMEVWDSGPPFASVEAGAEHTCALAPDGSAYCWGRNDYGQLGGESPNTCHSDYELRIVGCSRSPMPVAGDQVFVSLALGVFHTCGLTASGAAYC